MATRRSRPYEFDWSSRAHPCWIVQADAWWCPLKVRQLEPGADLFAAFLEEAAELHRAGWKLAGLRDESSSFLAKKGLELLRVNLTEEDPRRSGQYRPRQL